MEKVYTLTEISDLLKVTRRTLYNYIKDGKIKAIRVGREWRVTESAVQQFLQCGTAPKE